MRYKFILMSFAAIAFGWAAAHKVYAGDKCTSCQVLVTIDKTNRTASGNLGSARASSDVRQSIGCHVKGTLSTTIGKCAATDANGNTAQCDLNINLIRVVWTMRADSRVIFKWDANNKCTDLSVSTTSREAPKVL